jgi:hypothetical protein
MLDIDKGSPYHPEQDPLALSRIKAALEEVDLVECVTITSSLSGGLHLYFPFPELLSSWRVGLAVSSLLENAGFKVSPGLLEVFPNAKPFSSDGSISLFNGHRLPLQQGSYILNKNFEPTVGDEREFLRLWKFATSRNLLSEKTLEAVIKRHARKGYRVSGKAQKFLNDLNAEIEPGWSGAGQTNRLLGRIAMRAYVFGHVLLRLAKPLIGDALVEHIIEVARTLPGFDEWCSHCEEIEEKARQWARSVENSHYYPYGSDMKGSSESEESWNERQQAQARERITEKVAKLSSKGALPSGITTRFDALVGEGISGATLYRHKDLWHPRYLEDSLHPTQEDVDQVEHVESSPGKELQSEGTNKLVGKGGAGAPSPTAPPSTLEASGGSGGISTGSGGMSQEQGLSFLRDIVQGLKARKEKRREDRFRRLSDGPDDMNHWPD